MRILPKFISIIIFSYNFILLLEYQEVCGTPEPTEEEVNDSRRLVDDYWDLNGLDGRDYDPVHILVAWHVIYSSSGQGDISDLAIEQAVNNLNGAYNETFNYFLENNASFFKDKNFNSKNQQDVKFFNTNLHVKAQSDLGFTEIETINDSLVFEGKPFIIEKPLITINGWSLDENKKELDSIYLIVNGEPFLKYEHFYQRSDISKKLVID